MTMNRDFKGVWIPKEIWLNEDLSVFEKHLIAEIDSLDNDSRGCFASNEHLGRTIGFSAGSCANLISKLRKRGYLETTFSDGRKRGLRVVYKKISPEKAGEPSSTNEVRVHCRMKADFIGGLTLPSSADEHSNTYIEKNNIIETPLSGSLNNDNNNSVMNEVASEVARNPKKEWSDNLPDWYNRVLSLFIANYPNTNRSYVNSPEVAKQLSYAIRNSVTGVASRDLAEQVLNGTRKYKFFIESLPDDQVQYSIKSAYSWLRDRGWTNDYDVVEQPRSIARYV